VTVRNTAHDGPAILIEDCDDALVDGLTLQGQTSALSSGVYFRAATDGASSGLRIHNVQARGVKTAGILLESASPKATLADYLISDNLATVVDRIHGARAIIVNNAPASAQ